MSKSFTIFLFILVIQTVYGQNAGLKTIADGIKIENLKEKVYILASDSFQGRKTYQKGQKDAARYISGSFKTHDLKQLGGTVNYYQVYARFRLTPCFSHIQKKEDIGKKVRFPSS
jgi:hypothetical protein